MEENIHDENLDKPYKGWSDYDAVSTVQRPYATVSILIYKSELTVGAGLIIQSIQPAPNFFWRWMQYLFFGFKWKNLK